MRNSLARHVPRVSHIPKLYLMLRSGSYIPVACRAELPFVLGFNSLRADMAAILALARDYLPAGLDRLLQTYQELLSQVLSYPAVK